MSTVLITGASAGIGADFARIFAARGYNLALVARRKALLETLAEALKKEFRITCTVVAMDLSENGAPARLFEQLAPLNNEITNLINNAGFGAMGDFLDLEWEEQHRMMSLNMTALSELCHLYGRLFATRGDGAILNVASTAGFMPGPRMAAYFASKAFVVSLSEALSVELKPRGVRVTVLCPGATASEFQSVARMKKSRLAAMVPPVSSRAVAEFGYAALMRGRVVAVHGAANAAMTVLFRFLPRWVIRVIMREALKAAPGDRPA